MIEAGKVLQNRYRVQKQIGQGGMGAVYVATDERFGSIVAIKETLILEDNYRKAIEREARLLNSLKHPALPRVSDHFDEENGQFIVMEYIPGEDLADMLERSAKPFPIEKVLTWADQLLDALDFLHTQEIPVIHRDIKPQNLKLTQRGQIILLDFGLAKGNPTDASHKTAAKSIFGYSRNYASLEQIQGTGTDPRSDLYSLAATLYHLMTGAQPEDALTRAMYVLSEQADTLKPAHLVHAQVPKGVAAVLQKAMDLNANSRPATAREMRQMLREHETYAHLAADGKALSAKTGVRAANLTDVLNKETKLMPVGGGNQTDVKTEILPGNYAQGTSVGGGRTSANAAGFYTAENATPNRSKRRKVAAAALGSLFLVGSGLAGVYYFNPESFGAGQRAVKVSEQNNLVSETNWKNGNSAADAASNSANAAAPANIESAEIVNPETANSDADAKTSAASGPRTASTAGSGTKNEKNKAAKEKQKTQVGPDEVIVKGETVYVGNMKITEDRIETPEVIIDENGIKRKKLTVSPVPLMPPLTPEQLKKLTPEQRRKIMIYRQNLPKHPPPPAPKPTPKAPVYPKTNPY